MTTLFNNSETFFFKFLNKYDIILDENYNNIKDLYYLNKYSKSNYEPYLMLFNNYVSLKNDINFIYYIIILYYTSKNNLLSFIRFFTSKLNHYNLIDKMIIKDYNELISYTKIDLIKYLTLILNYNEEIVLFFIICIQLYF
jgi:hypothetical protein